MTNTSHIEIRSSFKYVFIIKCHKERIFATKRIAV